MTSRWLQLAALAVLATACRSEQADPLAARGANELAGVAAGLVSDEVVCAGCHSQQAEGYRTVAMSRSTSAPGGAAPEGELLEYFHGPSGRHYRLEPRAGRVWFSRWIEGPGGERRHLLELPVDFVIGSGAHGRSYVVRTAGDELFLLPVTWYEGLGLRMSPGFDRRDHLGVTRAVRRDCLVCHAATPALPAGGDRPEAPERFPAAIEPIGCQRCHGPGAEHARLAFAGARQAAREALVDLGGLAIDRQLALCESCHLQPSVALAATRAFDRGEYAFRPGMALGEHHIAAVLQQRGRTAQEPFEINHHAWRLRQSACFQESPGRPVCTDCHDPHRKLDADDLAATVRRTCSACHAGTQGCSEPAGRVDRADCAGCHMPRRRPEDVVHVVMTDHRISRRPPAGALDSRVEAELEIEALLFPSWGGGRSGAEGAAFLAVSALRSTGYRNDSAYEQLLAAAKDLEPMPREVALELARAALSRGESTRAQEAIAGLVARDSGDLAALELRARLALAGRAPERALADAEAIVAADPQLVEGWQLQGLAQLALGLPEPAVGALERAVALRELAPQLWVQLGEAQHRAGDGTAALASWRRALVIEPRTTIAWLSLAEVAQAAGDLAAARDLLEQAAVLVDDRDASVVLARLEQVDRHLPAREDRIAPSQGIAGMGTPSTASE
jgi:Flp pilus assembly protein TadD